MFFGRIYGLKGPLLRERVQEVLEMVALSDRADEAVSKYSGGMKRRINIAAGLLHKPKVLFLDEPTVGVDPQSRNAIFEGVESLNRAGMTIIYTTHYMEEAERLCNRVAIVDGGKIVAMNSPAELIRSLGGGVIIIGVDESRRDDVMEYMNASSSVKKATPSENRLVVETIKLQPALMEILDFTDRIDTRVHSLELLEPNLESVFLHLTGKSLRE
jgi:ABC-2 type transport system ATP-binding protein